MTVFYDGQGEMGVTAERTSDMNVCGAFGLRAMVNDLVVRADIGISDEGGAVQMTIDHPS